MSKKRRVVSKKRRLLEKNLIGVVKRAELGTTPVRITEIWAYGSFIRPKEDPGDVDIVLFHRPDEELDKKVNLVRDVLHNRIHTRDELWDAVWKEADEGKVDLLVKVMDELFGHDDRYRLWLEASRAIWVYEARSHGLPLLTIDTTKAVKAILLGKSHTIHFDGSHGVRPISEKEKVLAERPHRLIWSESSADVEANIRSMYKETADAVDRELPRFVILLDQADAEYSMIAGGIAYLLEQKKLGRDLRQALPSEKMEIDSADPGWGIPARTVKHAVSSIMEAGMVRWARKNKVDDDFLGAALSAAPQSFVKQLPDTPARTPSPVGLSDVEELRRRTKVLNRKLPFARELRRSLSHMREPSEYSANDPIVEAVYLAYIWTPMYLASDELRKEVLQDLGLGDVVIPQWMDKGPPDQRYRRP